jgi:hypothetical protein
MQTHDNPINHPYTTEAWQMLSFLLDTARPHDTLDPAVADFCAAHIGELSRVARRADHSGPSYANLSTLYHAFRSEPTGRTLLRNRIYVGREMPR